MRLGTPKQRLKAAKVQRKKDGDKNLRFQNVPLIFRQDFGSQGNPNGRNGRSFMQESFLPKMK